MYPPIRGWELETGTYRAPPRGLRIPKTARAGPEGLGCIPRSLGRSWRFNHTRPPLDGASLSPKWPTQDQRDWGVSAAMWGGAGSSIIPDPPRRGVPIPQMAHAGPEGLGCTCRCVGRSWKSNRTRRPQGASYAPKGPVKAAGTRLSAPLCGEEIEVQSHPNPLTGVPIPQTAQPGPEGPGCIRRCVGKSWKCNHSRPPPEGRPHPPNCPERAEGLGCICRCVGGDGNSIVRGTPTGRPYLPNGPGRSGGTRVSPPPCGEKLERQSKPTPPWGVPIHHSGPS